jgi:hypothetical protein
VQRQPLSAPNQEWAIDFASDIAASGQLLRVFSVVTLLLVNAWR